MTTDDELIRRMWYAYSSTGDRDDPMPAILAVVREHDGRDAERMRWLVDYMVEIEYEPTPEETVCIWLLMNRGLRRERYETSDLRVAINAAIAKGDGMSEWISNADNRLPRPPCDPDTRVDLVLRNGETRRGLAGNWGVCWRDDGTDYDIVKYRVIEDDELTPSVRDDYLDDAYSTGADNFDAGGEK